MSIARRAGQIIRAERSATHARRRRTHVFLPEAFEVMPNADSTLSAFGAKWERIESLLSYSAGGRDLIAFRADGGGRIVYPLRDAWAFERVPDVRR